MRQQKYFGDIHLAALSWDIGWMEIYGSQRVTASMSRFTGFERDFRAAVDNKALQKEITISASPEDARRVLQEARALLPLAAERLEIERDIYDLNRDESSTSEQTRL